MTYSGCAWLFSFNRLHRSVDVLGECVLLGRWSDKERRELYVDWMKANGLSPENPEHVRLINMRLAHCLVFSSPNHRLLEIAPGDGVEQAQRSLLEGDEERIGILLAEIMTWFKEIEAQKKASMPSDGSPSGSASQSGAPAPNTSGQS